MPNKQQSEQQRAKHECELCRDENIVLVKRKWIDLYPGDAGMGKDDMFVDTFQPCSCVPMKEVNRILKSSQITEKMKRRTFEAFNLEGLQPCVVDAHKIAKEYEEYFGRIRDDVANGLFIGGVPGSGKTHLCLAVCLRLLEARIPVMYFPYVEAMDEIKNNMGSNDAANHERQQKLQRVAVLYIDDLFKTRQGARVTDYEVKYMFGVINYRNLNHLPTIFSSERTISELIAIDAAVGSRIHEMTSGFQAVIQGDMHQLNNRLPPDE